jgi:two-component system chemotaxis response regulator CheB
MTRAVVIGASAGGVSALLTVLGGLPAAYSWPIVVVLHLPEQRHSGLAEVFQGRLAMRVKEAENKEPLSAGTVYFAAPGYHLSIETDRSFSLSLEGRVNYARPSIDVLFESAADAYGAALIAVLLTGANEDGAQGMQRVSQMGGLTVVQNPAEAFISIMPEAALCLCRPTHVLSLQDINRLLMELNGDLC